MCSVQSKMGQETTECNARIDPKYHEAIRKRRYRKQSVFVVCGSVASQTKHIADYLYGRDRNTTASRYHWALLLSTLTFGLKIPGVRCAAVTLFEAGLLCGAITPFFSCLLTRYSSTVSTLLYVVLEEGITFVQ